MISFHIGESTSLVLLAFSKESFPSNKVGKMMNDN